jgi:PAS domain S-box-containing protein
VQPPLKPPPFDSNLSLSADQVVRQVRDYAMFMIDRQGHMISWNQGVQHILGWGEADWLGQHFRVAFTETDATQGVPEHELSTAEALGRADDNRWMRRKDGARFFASGSIVAIHDETGAVRSFLKIIRDGTADHEVTQNWRHALEAEREMRARAQSQTAVLRATIDAIPDALYIGTAEGITQCNPQALELLGASSIEDLQAGIGELGARFRVRHERGGELVEPQELPFARALNGETATLVTWATRPGGDDVLIRGTAAPITVNGRIVGAVAVNSDLTDRVRLEEKRHELARVQNQLRAREEEFRALMSGVRDYAIFTVAPDGRISSWHIGAQLMKGYTDDEAIGMPFANLFTPEEQASGRPEQEMKVAAETGEYKGEGQRLRKSGERFEAAVVLTALRGPDHELLGYLKLTQDITQRKQAETEREAMLRDAEIARAEAERASHSKDEFLATISHELRTPLGAILGWSQLLERGIANAEGVKQGLAAITRNARVQVQLIEDLLDMNRIESGQLRLELQKVDLVGVVAAAIEAVQPSANLKNITLSTQLDATASQLTGDPVRLQQIVWNLLVNAVKFTPEGGQVTVSTAVRGDQIHIAVSDTGQGMDKDFVARAFDRFQQQDATRTRRHGGLGLGLSIVRQLTELHGGRVHAESQGHGLGSTFTVCLPLSTARTHGSPPPATTEAMPLDEQVEGGESRLAGFNLLLIDDVPDGRAVAAYALRDAGARVIEAASADQGLALLHAHRPHAILCDIGMPVHDGYEFIRWVREAEKAAGRHTPAAAFTAYASAQDRQRAIEAGYQAHLVKPLAPVELVQAVVALLRQEIGDTVGATAA